MTYEQRKKRDEDDRRRRNAEVLRNIKPADTKLKVKNRGDYAKGPDPRLATGATTTATANVIPFTRNSACRARTESGVQQGCNTGAHWVPPPPAGAVASTGAGNHGGSGGANGVGTAPSGDLPENTSS